MEIVPESINSYCLAHSTRPSAICEEIEAFTRSNVANPGMLSGALVGSFLGLMIRACGARRVVEVGTYTGYSALAMAENLPEGGEVVTLDRNAETQGLARGFWDKSPHGSRIRTQTGDARALLDGLKGPFDFAFIDADKGGYLTYLQKILPKLSSNGVVVADNCLWSGRVLDPSAAEADTQAIQRFNQWVTTNRELHATLVPLRDGLMVIKRV